MDVNVRKGMAFHLCLGDILIFTKRGKADRIEATKKGVVPVNNKEHSPQELARWLEETWGAQPVDYSSLDGFFRSTQEDNSFFACGKKEGAFLVYRIPQGEQSAPLYDEEERVAVPLELSQLPEGACPFDEQVYALIGQETGYTYSSSPRLQLLLLLLRGVPEEQKQPGNPQWEAWKHFGEEYRQHYGEDQIP